MTDPSPAILSSLNEADAVTPPPSPSENEEKPEPAPEGTELTKAESDLFTLLDLHPHSELEKLEREQVAIIWAKVEVFLDHLQQPFRRKYMFRGWTVSAYPLAMLCALRAPHELVHKAYQLFPGAGTNAFRRAVGFNPELETVQWLMGELPDAAKCPDDQGGHVALYCACENPNASLELVKCIYEAFPAAINARDRDRCTPLHWAMEKASVPVVQFMVGQVDSSALLLEANNGDTPLDMALLNEDYKVVQFVVKQYPGFVRTLREGWFPLHFVCDRAKSVRTVRLLLEHYPEAAKQKDVDGELPLALARKNEALSSNGNRLELLHLLVEAYPDSIDAVDNEGKPALDDDTKSKLLKHMVSKFQEHRSKRQKTCNK